MLMKKSNDILLELKFIVSGTVGSWAPKMTIRTMTSCDFL